MKKGIKWLFKGLGILLAFPFILLIFFFAIISVIFELLFSMCVGTGKIGPHDTPQNL